MESSSESTEGCPIGGAFAYIFLLSTSLDVLEETDEIVLNASTDLTVKNVSIHSEALKTEQTQLSTDFETDKEKERLSAKFATALPKGSKAQLHLGWEGKLQGNMLGRPFLVSGHAFRSQQLTRYSRLLSFICGA